MFSTQDKKIINVYCLFMKNSETGMHNFLIWKWKVLKPENFFSELKNKNCIWSTILQYKKKSRIKCFWLWPPPLCTARKDSIFILNSSTALLTRLDLEN